MTVWFVTPDWILIDNHQLKKIATLNLKLPQCCSLISSFISHCWYGTPPTRWFQTLACVLEIPIHSAYQQLTSRKGQQTILFKKKWELPSESKFFKFLYLLPSFWFCSHSFQLHRKSWNWLLPTPTPPTWYITYLFYILDFISQDLPYS